MADIVRLEDTTRTPRPTPMGQPPSTRPGAVRTERSLVQPPSPTQRNRQPQPHRLRNHQQPRRDRSMINTTTQSGKQGEPHTSVANQWSPRMKSFSDWEEPCIALAVDRMATLIVSDTDRVQASFASVAKHYGVGIYPYPPRHGNRIIDATIAIAPSGNPGEAPVSSVLILGVNDNSLSSISHTSLPDNCICA